MSFKQYTILRVTKRMCINIKYEKKRKRQIISVAVIYQKKIQKIQYKKNFARLFED